jgi:hypothetical protein
VSERRRAKAAVGTAEARGATGGVPNELFGTFRDHDCWQSEEETQLWFTAHGLIWEQSGWPSGEPWGRRDDAARAWCRKNGLVDKWGHPAAGRCRELGFSASTRARDRFQHVMTGK